MKYRVHVYRVMRFAITDIEAESHEEAMKKADEQVGDYIRLVERPGNGDSFEDAEETTGYLVDHVGDEDFENSRFYDADHQLELPK